MANEVNAQKMRWYLVGVKSGNEDHVAENIRSRRVSMGLEDYIGRIVVVNEEVLVTREGKPVYTTDENGNKVQKTKIRNFFPGYIYVEMIMTDDSWYMVRNTEGVTGIVGSAGGGQKPTPIRPREMEKVLKRAGLLDDKDVIEEYHVGDLVRVIRGTFEKVEAKISEINVEKKVVKINAIFFGRETPIEVDLNDIVKV